MHNDSTIVTTCDSLSAGPGAPRCTQAWWKETLLQKRGTASTMSNQSCPMPAPCLTNVYPYHNMTQLHSTMIITYTNAHAVHSLSGQTIHDKRGNLKLLLLQHCHAAGHALINIQTGDGACQSAHFHSGHGMPQKG